MIVSAMVGYAMLSRTSVRRTMVSLTMFGSTPFRGTTISFAAFGLAMTNGMMLAFMMLSGLRGLARWHIAAIPSRFLAVVPARRAILLRRMSISVVIVVVIFVFRESRGNQA
jgi:hypothetical protein